MPLLPPPCQPNPFSHLTAVEKAELRRRPRTKLYKKGEFIFLSDDLVKGIYWVKCGIVKISQTLGERAVTIRFATKDEWIGHPSIFTSNTSGGTAHAREKTIAHFVSTNLLHHFFMST
ncbi:MAG: cyclic nucleotide-binding domain-containing protein [Bdellovibrionales bacterium]|nr:cyclic nucleotide-binding domain-containing protein [Bdellovibrionales bacterium]